MTARCGGKPIPCDWHLTNPNICLWNRRCPGPRPCPGCPDCKPCEECGGLGWVPVDDMQIGCTNCNGTGVEP